MKTFSQFLIDATDPKGPIKKYMSPEEIAKKHKTLLKNINDQIKMGIKVEGEHTSDKKMARMIALQHLGELPDYYSRLKKVEKIKEERKSGDYSLHDWFSKSKSSDNKPGWVQLGGPYAGKPCARQPGQKSTPKCGSSKMKRNLSAEEEEKAFNRKNRKDPNQPQKSGAAKPTNVATEETILEKKDACYHKVKSRYKVWPSAYASGALVKCRKKGSKNWGKTSVKENYTRIQTRGTTYAILLNWRGKYLNTQMFFPQFTRPSKSQVSYEVEKIYPGAKVLSFNPSVKDPTKPLLFPGDDYGPK